MGGGGDGEWESRLRGSSYNLFNTSRDKIWCEWANTEFEEVTIKLPYPLKECNKLDKSIYCHFEKSHDHNTYDCIQLKDAIKELINKGCLTEYNRTTAWKVIGEENGPIESDKIHLRGIDLLKGYWSCDRWMSLGFISMMGFHMISCMFNSSKNWEWRRKTFGLIGALIYRLWLEPWPTHWGI